MKIFIDQNGNAVFGENGVMYPLSYYFDILEMKEESIFEITSDQICEYLIHQINNDNYIILDLNYKRLYNKWETTFWLHETLIYGYDIENKKFLTSILEDGVFKEVWVEFSVIETAYEDAVNYYIQEQNRIYNRRLWFYGITIVSIKNSYKNTNVYFDFLSKLKYQLEGNIYLRQKNTDKLESGQNYKYYTGVAAVWFLRELIQQKMKFCSRISSI